MILKTDDVLAPGDADLLSVLCLYRTVLGRSPDPEGLAAYAGQLRDGRDLSSIAAELVHSGESRDKRDPDRPAAFFCHNAFGRDPDASEAAADLVDLALSIVAAPDFRARQSLLALRYPDGIGLDDAEGYAAWLERQGAERARRFPPPPAVAGVRPELSIVVWIDDPADLDRAACLASIEAQSDDRWEAVMVTRGPLGPALTALPDERVRHVAVAGWRSRRAALAAALRRCRGTFVALLGAQDRLAPSTVAELALIAERADVVLSDEDGVERRGGPRRPKFGAAWDPDLALAQEPVGLLAVRTQLARAAGGWRAGADGAEDWDLLLRAARRTPLHRLRRLPAVLLHRGPPRPVADPGAAAAARRERIRAHLKATGRGGSVVAEPFGAGPLRVVHPLPRVPPPVSIIIPTRDRADLLRTCLAGLLQRTDYPALEIIVVDNESREPATAALLAEASRDGRVRVLREEGAFNWPAFNNRGVAAMRGEIAVFLNNDTDVIEAGWLREMVAQALRPEVGLVAAKLLYADDTIQHAGVVLGPAGAATHVRRHLPADDPGQADELRTVHALSAATGACLAIRRSVFEVVRGIEQEHLKVTWSDTDLCLRVRAAGYRVVWTPFAKLYHVELATRGSDQRPEAAARFAREHAHIRATWGRALDEDRHESPSLRPGEGATRLDASFAWVPLDL